MQAPLLPSPPPSLSAGGVEPAPGLVDLWFILRRQWRLIAAIALVPLVGVALLLARQVPSYEATASIRIDEKPMQIPTLDVVRLSMGSQIDTEMEMLRSRTLAGGVVDSLALRFRLVAPVGISRDDLFSRIAISQDVAGAQLRLEQHAPGQFLLQDRATAALLGTVGVEQQVTLPGVSFSLTPLALHHRVLEFDVIPRDAAVQILQAGLKVKRPNTGASIVLVTYRGTDPQLVREVPNILASRLITERREVRQTETRSTAQFLRDQIAKLSEEHGRAENSLRSFREAEHVVSLADQTRSAISQSAELQAQRSAMNAERVALAQLLAATAGTAAQAGSSHPYRDLVAFPSLLRNQAVSGLLSSLAGVEDRRTELLSRRRPSDPEVQVLTDRIHQIENQLHSVATTYLQGLNDQVQALDATLAQSGAQMARIPARELEAARLQRDAQALQEIVTLLTSRLKEAEIAEAVEDPSVRLVDAAGLPAEPTSQRRSLLLGASLFVGLLLGVAVAFTREYMDTSIRTRGDTQIATRMPVLGIIPRIRPAEPRREGVLMRVLPLSLRQIVSRASSLDGPAGSSPGVEMNRHTLTPAADAYDRVHTNVLFSSPAVELKTLLVTSPLPGDGKTTTATNLAITLAQRGLRVLLIDADLRRGLVQRALQLPSGPGLTEVLTSDIQLSEALHSVHVGSGMPLHVLTAGEIPTNPAQILGSSRMRTLLDRFRNDYDRIILDSSPINVVADAALLATHLDGTILVARAGVTPFDALVYAAEQLRKANLPVIGTVLNDIAYDQRTPYDPAYQWLAYGKSYYARAGPG